MTATMLKSSTKSKSTAGNANRKDKNTMKNNFLLLITGINETDRSAKDINPQGQDIVFCKAEHARPCDSFNAIRELQLRLRDSDYAKGKRVTAVIDLSEWIGHENEEYLDILMKFLCDKRKRIDYIFTVGNASADRAEKLMKAARPYMRGAVFTDDTFMSIEKLAGYISLKPTEEKAAALLAKMLKEPKMNSLLSYRSVDDMCLEMLESSPVGIIRAVDVSEYLRSQFSMPFITDKTVSLEYSELADKLTPDKESDVA